MAKIAIIDPGHGGRDPGAIGPSGLQEKVVTMAVAKRVTEILRWAGIDARLTRESDKHFATSLSADLSARAKLANQARADVFVSIHCNSSTNWSASGTETYHFPGSAAGQRLAQCLQRQLVVTLRLKDRGVKQKDFTVLRESAMPAALVELAFICNLQEEELLKSAKGQEKAAWAIAQGLAEYLGVPIVPPASNMFKDVPATHWAVEAIERLVKLGIMTVYEDGDFRPDEPINRAQIAVIVNRALKILDSTRAK